MGKRKEDSLKTKRLLLDTALKVFSQKGYMATRLEDIANEAGVTRGAIYWHFKNKVQLFCELNNENRARTMEIVDKVWSGDYSPVEKLRQVFIQFLIFFEKDKKFRDFNELILFKTEIINELQDEICHEKDDIENHINRIIETVKESQEQNFILKNVDPKDFATAFLSYIHGIMSLWILKEKPFSMEEKAEIFVDMFLKSQLT